MDILNFISWIKGKRIVTSVDPAKTLLPVALKDSRRDDDYLTGAITVEDFAASIVTPPAYKVYSANIEMATGAINNLFENTLGVTLTWVPASGEINTGIVIGLIGQNNVFVQVSSCTITSSPKIVSGQFTPAPWIVTIKQTDDAGVLDSTQSVYVEIRVYN
jgi:hypothetical protein